MEPKQPKYASVDDYIAAQEPRAQAALNELRQIIREAAPEAEERISYHMPGFFLNGGLVWFGAYQKHIGLYPITEGLLAALPAEVVQYRGTKSALHFPLDQPLPRVFLRALVRVRVEENAH